MASGPRSPGSASSGTFSNSVSPTVTSAITRASLRTGSVTCSERVRPSGLRHKVQPLHPDHRSTLARSARHTVAQIYDSGPDDPHGGGSDGSSSLPRRTTAPGLHLPRLPRRGAVARRPPVPGNRRHRSRAVRPLGPRTARRRALRAPGTPGPWRRRLRQSMPTTANADSWTANSATCGARVSNSLVGDGRTRFGDGRGPSERST